MASTSPFEQAEPPFGLGGGRPAGNGARAARRAASRRAREAGRGEATRSGFPGWEGLAPVILFLIAPIVLILAIVVTGGEWEWWALYPPAALLGGYVFLSTFRTVELALACLLFYLPFSTSYVIPLAPGVNGTNMLLLLALFASILRVADKRQGWVAWPPGTALVFFFGLLSIASGFTTMLLPGGYAYLVYGEILSYKAWIDQFLFYFIVLSCVRDVEAAKRMVVYMAIGSIVLVLYSVPEMLDKGGNSTIEKSRIEGPHQQSNQFGGFVSYTLLPVLAIFIVYIRDARAWLVSPYFLIAFKVLITTFSRGAYLAIALGGLCAGFFKGKGFLAFWAMTALAFLLVFPQLLPSAIVDRMGFGEQAHTTAPAASDGPVELDKSSEHRLILWRAAGRMILEDPLTGKGFKAFPKLKAQYTERDVHESDPHNMYLYLGAQMGLPVLSLFLLILGYSFWLGRTLSRHRDDKFIRAIGIGGASSTACYAVICVFGSRAVNLEFSAYFWTMLVVMQVIRKFELADLAAAAPARRQRGAAALAAMDPSTGTEPGAESGAGIASGPADGGARGARPIVARRPRRGGRGAGPAVAPRRTAADFVEVPAAPAADASASAPAPDTAGTRGAGRDRASGRHGRGTRGPRGIRGRAGGPDDD